jgi:electron transfer flavoprotein alpha subunit
MRVAALVKQVPRFEEFALGPDGRLQREGLELEMDPYSRRAVSKGVELARASGGRCTVVTLGPPAAEDCLREGIAWGADDGVLITDPAFAGSDTLATARALAAALTREGPFDLVLVGRNSVDADTGQVGPELAELLGLPFATGVRELDVADGEVKARCEYDDGYADLVVPLPAVLSTAERLCEPAKVDPPGRAAVPAERIRRLSATDLGSGPWGQGGSPTAVGAVRVHDVARAGVVLNGPVDEQVRAAVDALVARGALSAEPPESARGAVPSPTNAGGPAVAVLVEPDRGNLTRELLGAAARLAAEIGGHAVAVASGPVDDRALSSWGADRLVQVRGVSVEEDVAAAVASWARAAGGAPWAILAPSTAWGREVASRVAARIGAGLTGDAVDLEVGGDGRLVAWKPAFGGKLVAAITASSPVQMATVRAGVLELLTPRPSAGPPITVERIDVEPRSALQHSGTRRDDDLDDLASAHRVVGIGTGVAPDDYGELEPLLELLGAELGATRKVTDKGWLPRARQIGITGRSIAPRLYVSIGASGKFNHIVGFRSAGTVLAVNADPDALVFGAADVGIVAPWRDVVAPLTAALAEVLA